MGDLGSDAGQSVMSLSAKFLEAILKIFEIIMRHWAERPRRELAKQQLKLAKSEEEKREILSKMNGKVGAVNYNELKKSGMPLSPIGVYMTKADMKELAAICKREGILFSGMTDNVIKNEDGIKTYHIVCKREDLERMLRAIDRLNEEKIINEKNEEIQNLEAKGENMTDKDKARVAELKKEIEDVKRSYSEKWNAEMAGAVIDGAVVGKAKEKLTLSEALNRITGRTIDQDVFSIVADANDPSKYIRCHGYQAFYKGEPYIKTDYEVCRDGKTVLKTDDGRFDNRPKFYWEDQKKAIKDAGQFSDTFFKFYSATEYQRWAENLKRQNEQELTSMEVKGEKDYGTIIKELEKQLDKDGAKMKDGKVVDKETEKLLAISQNMTPEQRATIAEAVTIGKQINNYTEMTKINEQISLAQVDVYALPEGTEERASAEQHLSQLQERQSSMLEKESQLINERKDINAVQAEQETRNVEKEVHNEERSDDRRGDITEEKEEHTMEDFKGKIQDEKKKDAEKGNSPTDNIKTNDKNKNDPER